MCQCSQARAKAGQRFKSNWILFVIIMRVQPEICSSSATAAAAAATVCACVAIIIIIIISKTLSATAAAKADEFFLFMLHFIIITIEVAHKNATTALSGGLLAPPPLSLRTRKMCPHFERTSAMRSAACAASRVLLRRHESVPHEDQRLTSISTGGAAPASNGIDTISRLELRPAEGPAWRLVVGLCGSLSPYSARLPTCSSAAPAITHVRQLAVSREDRLAVLRVCAREHAHLSPAQRSHLSLASWRRPRPDGRSPEPR